MNHRSRDFMLIKQLIAEVAQSAKTHGAKCQDCARNFDQSARDQRSVFNVMGGVPSERMIASAAAARASATAFKTGLPRDHRIAVTKNQLAQELTEDFISEQGERDDISPEQSMRFQKDAAQKADEFAAQAQEHMKWSE